MVSINRTETGTAISAPASRLTLHPDGPFDRKRVDDLLTELERYSSGPYWAGAPAVLFGGESSKGNRIITAPLGGGFGGPNLKKLAHTEKKSLFDRNR